MAGKISTYARALSVDDYYRLRTDLFRQHPEDLGELHLRCINTGSGSNDADEVWRCMGDKPLFMNNSVKAGRRSEQAWALDLFPGWAEFSSDGWGITDLAYGHPRSSSRFELKGEMALDFINNRLGKNIIMPNGEQIQMPRIAKFRLYAMQQFARWLRSHAAGPGINKIDALKDIGIAIGPGAPIEMVRRLCVKLAGEFGLGWGVTTVLHGLMDAGFYVVKPDVHLVQTVAKLGCLGNPSKALADPGSCLRSESFLFEVVGVARDLAAIITPLPESLGKAIREVDVVLMRANYRGVVNEFSRTI